MCLSVCFAHIARVEIMQLSSFWRRVRPELPAGAGATFPVTISSVTDQLVFIVYSMGSRSCEVRCYSSSKVVPCSLVGLLELCGCRHSRSDDSSIFFSRPRIVYRASPSPAPATSNLGKSQCAYRHGSSDLAGQPLQGCMQHEPGRCGLQLELGLAFGWTQFQLRVPREPAALHLRSCPASQPQHQNGSLDDDALHCRGHQQAEGHRSRSAATVAGRS